MVICHIAPFAPNRCGLYEACRDMLRADSLAGHQVIFVDSGITINGERQSPIIDGIDDRAGFKLETSHPDKIDEADIIIMHNGCPDGWLVRNQAPIIWVIHGRPLACFRPEINGKSNSYSLYVSLSKWKRAKKMLFFWDEFYSYWKNVIPENKLECLEYPVVDENRFNYVDEESVLVNKGEYNYLICDSSREDIDLFELVNGCIEAARYIEGIKFHFYGFDFPLHNCWNILLGKLKEIGALGDLVGRVQDMEKVYRSCDYLISPNRIITRTIAESMSCGTPVIAQLGCKVADYTCDFANITNVASTILRTISVIENGINRDVVIERSKVFSIENYNKRMNKIYEEVITS